MKKSIATVSLSGSLREKLEAVAAAGFTGVEIFENDLLSFDGTAQDIRHMVTDLGLEIVVFQPFRDFEGMPEPQRSRNFDRAERKFDLMAELGVELLLVCSNVSPASLGGIQRAADDFRELGERAAKRNLRIGFEALAWGKHISDYRDAWEVVRRADHPAVGTIIDSFHVLAREHDLTALSSIPGDRIFLIHIADAPLMQMDYLYWSRHFRCFPGQGRLPLDQFMTALQPTGYNDWYSLEIFNDHFRAAPTGQTALDGNRSLLFLGEQAVLDRPEPNNVDGTERRSSLVPQPAFAGVEFVEFALDEETAVDFADLFHTLGFQQVGTHRSKDVTLWQQGDIRLVINTDKEGFAHEYNLVHGPSVCAIGLQVDDAQQALERANLYRCQSYRSIIGPNETEIPAIRGLDDHLLYLVDGHGGSGSQLASFWDVDFILDKSAAHKTTQNAAVGLRTIDHLSHVTASGQLSSAVLFYHAVLGFQVAPQYDIVDPHGLIQSQVVETGDHTIRIALNASQNQGTMAGRFMSEYFGSGVQQVAFGTDDIFATVKQLEANGISLLPMPENYYDDLDARFGLDPELLEALRQHNILYDRRENTSRENTGGKNTSGENTSSKMGEFFHVYTPTYANRFFFEIVQRRDYREFGAVNAPIRLAAQARMAL